jgi:prevent-host-death family protein
MQTATVRELQNNTSQLLRRAAKEDVIITSRGRPVARLVGLRQEDIEIQRSCRINYADARQKEKAFRLLDQIWKIKADKGKHWVSQKHHDATLYGAPTE